MFKFVALLSAAACVYAASAPYTTKYDNINLDEILNNERLVSNYIKCLLDEGTCTPDGAELKSVLPDALKNNCNSCSEKQKSGSKRIFKFLIEKKPEEYAKLEQKYDPEGTYKEKYQAELKKLDLNVADTPVADNKVADKVSEKVSENTVKAAEAAADNAIKAEAVKVQEAAAAPVEAKPEQVKEPVKAAEENKTPSN